MADNRPWDKPNWWGTPAGFAAFRALQAFSTEHGRAPSLEENDEICQQVAMEEAAAPVAIPAAAEDSPAKAQSSIAQKSAATDSTSSHRMKNKPLTWIIGIIAAVVVLFVIPSAFEPPISILFRNGMIGRVMVLTNTSDKTLHEVTVRAHSSRTHEKVNRIVAVTLEPHRSIEVGWTDNWVFEAGEDFTISAKGYVSNITGTVW